MMSPAPPWYPRFEPGQVITHDDLNQMQTQLREQTRLDRRYLYGFGAVNGLTARVSENTFTLQAGAAVDQVGRYVVVPDTHEIALTTDVRDRGEILSSHPLVEAPDFARCNFTPVLQYDQIRETNRQSDVDPAVRGERVRPAYRVMLVPGRLKPPPTPDFYRVWPILMPHGLRIVDGVHFSTQFYAVRDKLARAYERAGLDAEPLSILKSTRLTGEERDGLLPGRDLALIALYNDLIYTGWQWARAQLYIQAREVHLCSDLNHLESDDSGQKPVPSKLDATGIPLGWLSQDEEGKWKWDPRYQMAFHLSLALLDSVHGYPCQRIAEDALARAGRMLESYINIGAERGSPPKAAAEWLAPFEYVGGVQTWLPGAGGTLPREWTRLWPVDPLRGFPDAPRPVLPGQFASDQEDGRSTGARTWSMPRLSPSYMEPLNQPYRFSTDSEAWKIDPGGNGLLRLTALLGHPLEEVKQALLGVGLGEHQIAGELSQADAANMQPLRFLLLAPRDVSLYVIFDQKDQSVLGFATAEFELVEARPDASPPAVTIGFVPTASSAKKKPPLISRLVNALTAPFKLHAKGDAK